MQEIVFYKYQGAGNDFVIIDNRDGLYSNLTQVQIESICDRRFGIGADGLMLLENDANLDFYMRYFNADGGESSMCGNGGRCIVAFAHKLGLIDQKTTFNATDGKHEACLFESIVDLKMIDVDQIEYRGSEYFMDTGSPHYVKFVENISSYKVYEKGREIRYNEEFKDQGTNVNFLELTGKSLKLRTYERGVEDETLACGTGTVAGVLAYALENNIDQGNQHVFVQGGELEVRFEKSDQGFKNIWLKGPADFVFQGEIKL